MVTALEDPLPDQGLCLGASFTIAATNGVDPTRRLHLLGFCRSVEHLSRQVENCVLRRGGEIMLRRVELRRCGLRVKGWHAAYGTLPFGACRHTCIQACRSLTCLQPRRMHAVYNLPMLQEEPVACPWSPAQVTQGAKLRIPGAAAASCTRC